MNRQHAFRLGPWILLFLVEGASGCRRVDAAPSPYPKPPPTTARDPQPDQSNLPDRLDPGLVKNDARRREGLLAQLKPTLRPHKPSPRETLAKETLKNLFLPGAYLPAKLLEKITVSDPPTCGLAGCYVDVTYPDWTTFAAVDRALLRHDNPFTTFPGPRYRTGRVPKENKFEASWVLTFTNDGSYEGKGGR